MMRMSRMMRMMIALIRMTPVMMMLGTLMKCRTVLLGHASNRTGWTNKLPQALPLSRSAASYDYLPSLKNKMDKQTK